MRINPKLCVRDMLNRKFIISVAITILTVLMLGSAQILARMKMPEAPLISNQATGANDPAYCLTAHRVGNLVLAVTNNGTFGIQYISGADPSDCFTGETIGQSVQFPKGSNTRYLYSGSFWIGAVIGRDTLVSLGHTGWSGSSNEFTPNVVPIGNMIRRSIIDPTSPQFEGAISEEDLIAVYTDTIMESVAYGTDIIAGRSHKPLNIEVVERSFAWSYPYAEDFVLFDYAITNIGQKDLVDVYMGLAVDSDIGSSGGVIHRDDISGFLKAFPSPLPRFKGCGFMDTVNIAWTADNDGDLTKDAGDQVPNVTATRIVRTPNADSLEVSFNWWVSGDNDFGPRHRTTRYGKPLRSLGHGGLGTPVGDANKYAFLSNKEFDYDQPLIGSIGDDDPVWLSVPDDKKWDWTDGLDTRYLLSFGPFDIGPGQTLPLSFAYIGGENFHTDPQNLQNLKQLTYDPTAFYANLGWDDLALNSVWAGWLFDNPGVDTDGNGYFGEQRICIREFYLDSIWDTTWFPDSTIESIVLDTVITVPTRSDTVWYKGDGVPDFKGAQPPPAPSFTIKPMVGALKIRFNGTRSETTRDNFSSKFDFEGYRVYLARDPRVSSYGMFTSYDLEDYNRYVLEDGEFKIEGTPFTMDSLRCLYGDPDTPGGPCNDDSFDPLSYSITNTLRLPNGEEMYFLSQGENMSHLGVNTEISKVYPNQPYPSSLDPLRAHPDEVTPEGNLKYFEYEVLIPDLLEGVEYWVSVTAFDFGSPESGLGSLETAIPSNAKAAYPVNTWDEVERLNLEVYVYPNPYRIDANYRERGFEGRTERDRPPDRTRVINFGNLPPKCTIRIFTLDGDLVQEIEHNRSPGDGDATNDSWDLISRNFQLVVSGLYFWTVEDERGNTQIGKLSIIM
jgi:hypothetical protein